MASQMLGEDVGEEESEAGAVFKSGSSKTPKKKVGGMVCAHLPNLIAGVFRSRYLQV
eukprot:SAG31_NODE_5461_length_2523_cov_4.317244_2_plen_57_part_00